MLHLAPPRPPRLPLALLLALTTLMALTPHATVVAAEPAVAPAPPPASAAAALPLWAQGRTHLSSAALAGLRDQYRRGVPFDPATVRRLGLDIEECGEGGASVPAAGRTAAPARGAKVATVALGTDRQINDKSGDVTCSNCSNRPLQQAETTIATSGAFELAGWNDTKGFCPPFGAVQGYGYSTDGGVTWVDGGDVPTPITGARWRGDPVHGVNRKTGDFYIAGLFENPTNVSFSPSSGLALARGHFSGGVFVFDLDAQISTAGSVPLGPNFHDKDWMTADSVSGNVYVTYSDFINVNSDSAQIELLRSTTNGASWDPPVVLSPLGWYQGTRVLAGPAGEVYVVWYEYGYPLSHLWVRKSTTFGASFGPQIKVADFYENGLSGAPGFRRGGSVPFPGAAVDCSTGPHRGRVYVTWDEGVNFYDAPAPAGANVFESESNDFFARAASFSIGDILHGQVTTNTDVDLYRFAGVRGQTLFIRTQAADGTLALNLRLVCAADTTNINNYRFLAFDQSTYPALCFTLPATGDYYLRMDRAGGTAPDSYTLFTSLDTPSAGERARDHRDRFVTHSDDGATWSAPVRLDDDDPWYDGVYPEITVDGTGAAHCYWHDFRDDAGCGALSYEYMTSSADGGFTWGPNRRVSDVQSFWSVNTCGSANQGDYQGVTSEGATFHPCWSDSRLGDPDAFTDAPTFQHEVVCPAPAAGNGGATVTLDFDANNTGNVNGNYSWTLTDDDGWLTSASIFALSSTGSLVVRGTFTLPSDCTPAATDTVRFVATDTYIPGRTASCKTTIACSSVIGVGSPAAVAFSLGPARPNPSARGVTLPYGLPRASAVQLGIYGARGERVRALAVGPRPAGSHLATWDGRDERGRPVAPGVYYARLVAAGRMLERSVVVVR